MSSINKVFLLGTLGADPDVRYTASGTAVCNLRLATNRTWKDKNGDKQEEVEWSSVVLYDRAAEIAGEYLRKGRQVHIEGRLKTRKWQDKDGNDRYTTEIVSESMTLIGGRDGAIQGGGDGGSRSECRGRSAGGDEGGRGGQRSAPQGRAPAPSRGAQQPASRAEAPFGNMDDDVPW